MSCRTCTQDLICCHEPVIEHADGTVLCADLACTLDVQLHGWWVTCAELDPPCPCVPDEANLLPLAA